MDVAERPELRIDPRQHRRAEHAADDARDLDRAPGGLGDRVDPAQDQAVEAVRKLEHRERAADPRVDALRTR